MRADITFDREANSIRQRRSTFLGTFLLVEGDTDKKFYRRFVDQAVCTIVVTSGKPSSKLRVINILKILDESGFRGALGIVDADFDLLESLPEDSPNVVRTDTHDLEAMMLAKGGFEKLLNEYTSDEKLPKFIKEHGDVRKIVLAAGMQVGYLRWVSQRKNLNLSFSNIKFGNFLDKETLQFDVRKFIQEVKNKSQAQALKSEDLQQQILAQQNDRHDPWQVCCGHDLMEILALAFCKAIGTFNANEVTIDTLERSLRLAYEASWFPQTNLYREIQAWETGNSPFWVLSRAFPNRA
jgi:hypothetical protein